MSEEIKKHIWKVIIGILITIIIYALLGISFNIIGVRIYDEFPEKFICSPSNPEVTLSGTIRNNAPATFPFLNPFYGYSIVIVDSKNDAYAYFTGSGEIARNFTDWRADVGRIDSGDYYSFVFFLHPDEGNVTFKIKIWLDLSLTTLEASSATYFVEYHENYNYTISKTS